MSAAADPMEQELLLRVLGALLREDVVGLRSASSQVERADGRWLRLAGESGAGAGAGDGLLLPVAEDGYQATYAARLPLLRRESCGADLTTCEQVLRALRRYADPADRPGFDAFAEECRRTLATMRLHEATRDELLVRLAAEYGTDVSRWRGHRGSLAHDALAARLDHPVYPTSRGRAGLGEDELRRYAPEFHPRYRLRWLALPRQAVTTAGRLAGPFPVWWPTPAVLGLPELDGSHLALPVHPLTVGTPQQGPLHAALRATGLGGQAVLAGRPHLDLVPTLSMRTGALVRDTAQHLKLPIATATLGARNRRTIKPGTLVDGAACQRLLEEVIAREPRFKDSVLLADEATYAHAGHELLACLLRTYPSGLDDAAVVPMAALLARAPDGLLVIDHLADRFYDGAPLALLDAVLRLLFDWQTTLFGYGIALESHQQNIQLAFDEGGGVRLLLKDNDGPRINAQRLHERLGLPHPDGVEFDDARIFTAGDGPLAELFTTITLHLCAGSYAFGLARHGRAPLHSALRLVRERLAEAVDGLEEPGPRAVLRQRVLDAGRWPVKAMVTAGTLLAKERSGAADINKHYTTGPNYLRVTGVRR